MKKETLNFDVVREIGRTLPRVTEERYYGMPALKVDGEMIAVQTGHRSAEPNSISVQVGFKRRDELIATDPEIFYLKPHYKAYPVVLVRLDRITREALGELLRSAYDAISTGTAKRAQRVRRPKQNRSPGLKGTALWFLF